ncbi:hypothetical protein BXY41_106308 [Lacrimispora xylanisolvens]|uniref:Uncharacterized protein n=1 Tax=Lacrimispora xylanisolvens TaxID=384636 RepID=A0A2S6HSR0_9FIRM|nr:hypothetical protein [Hungatella xylanolytica]PPK80717.1 hypothetical protein BXY41_106308 [Hungatella xylanolytica]
MTKYFYIYNIIDERQYKYNRHLIYSEDFYNKYVRGKEEDILKMLNCRIMSIKVSGEINFIHKTNFSNKDNILKDGLKGMSSSETDTLGKGIYVHDLYNYINQNKYVKSNSQRIVVTGMYKGEYLKCVYSPRNVGADGRLGEGSREYLILEDISPNSLSVLE